MWFGRKFIIRSISRDKSHPYSDNSSPRFGIQRTKRKRIDRTIDVPAQHKLKEFTADRSTQSTLTASTKVDAYCTRMHDLFTFTPRHGGYECTVRSLRREITSFVSGTRRTEKKKGETSNERTRNGK